VIQLTRIEFLRREKGIKQKVLAQMVGDWACNVAQIEHGIRKPWPRIRKAIAEALSTREAELFDARGVPLNVDWTLPLIEESQHSLLQCRDGDMP